MRRMPASSMPPAASPPAPDSRQILGVFGPSCRGPGISAAAMGAGASKAAPAPCKMFRRDSSFFTWRLYHRGTYTKGVTTDEHRSTQMYMERVLFYLHSSAFIC